MIGNFLKVAPDEVDIIFESVDTVPPSYRTAVNSAAWLLDVLTRGQSRRINIVDAAEKLSIRPLALCVIGTRIPVRTLHSARQVHGKKRIVSDKQRGATNLDLASPKALTEVLRRTMRGYGAASNDGRAQQ